MACRGTRHISRRAGNRSSLKHRLVTAGGLQKARPENDSCSALPCR